MHWLLVACLALASCHGCEPPSADYGADADSASDGGAIESDAGPPPGTRPQLDSAGDVVPLLYGRFVEVLDQRDGASDPTLVPLDDPSHWTHREFFADLNAACRAEVDATLAAAQGSIVIPGCGRDGVYEGHLAACRARASQAFAAPNSDGALIDGPPLTLDLAGNAPPDARLWTVSSDNLRHRASWAMFAVEQLRRTIGALGFAFDPEYCPLGLSEPGNPSTESLSLLAARALGDASDRLTSATTLADQLLATALEGYASLPDSPETRVAATRGLNDSELERMKLYVGVPYGAFRPEENEPVTGVDAPGRYPVLYARPSARIEDVASMLAALRADVLDPTGAPRAGAELVDLWFASLRDAQPLVFGSLGNHESEAALAAFDLDLSELEQAASYLSGQLRVTGAPHARTPLARPEYQRLESLAHLDRGGPDGYVYTLTEALARADDRDERGYAMRGLPHALEYAQRAATSALNRSDSDPAAHELLQQIANPETSVRGRGQLCTGPGEHGPVRTLQLLLPTSLTEDVARERYELFRGESDVVCALEGRLFERECAFDPPRVEGAFDPAAHALAFTLEEAPALSNRAFLTERDLDPEAVHGRRVIAASSLAVLDPSEEEHCMSVPLDERVHVELARIHADAIEGVLPRVPVPPQGKLSFSLSSDTPVPVLWERTLRVTDPGQDEHTLTLSQPFEPHRQALENSIQAACSSEPLRGTDSGGDVLCDATAFARVHELRCLREALRAPPGALGAFTLPVLSPQEALSLRLWAYEVNQQLTATLAHALASFACAPITGATPREGDAELEEQLWSLAKEASELLISDHGELRQELEAAVVQRWHAEADEVARIGSIRALHDSRLAAARLLVAVPFGLFDPSEERGDPLDHALERFPVVTQPVRTAEDARIEGLLRTARLHPLLPDLSITEGRFDAETYEAALAGGTLATRLRERMVALDPATYDGMPTGAAAFLAALGVSRTDLRHAAARIVQLAEARGPSLLAVPDSVPVQAIGISPVSPAPQAAHLYALTEGRAHLAEDAWPTNRGMRGAFHALGALEHALRRRLRTAGDWDPGVRETREQIHAAIAAHATFGSLELLRESREELAQGLTVQIALPADTPVENALERFDLWWTDAGIACAVTGTIAGEPCTAEDFRFDESDATITRLADDLPGEQRVSVAGLAYPQPASWNPDLTLERTRGRVYVTERFEDGLRTVASLSLSALREGMDAYAMPAAPAWSAEMSELLAYREEGEGCARCAPRSVCERTSCELGLCLREPLDGMPCAGDGQCMAGLCDSPGCGDGARSDGSDGVPFEACDDGNLIDGDGCSVLCTVETRQLEPLIEEGWPAGPAPAVAVDGLGHGLLVYSTDNLTGETVSIRGARFDAFGVQAGTVVVEAALPRGYHAEPNVAGLENGGFVVVYATPDVNGHASIAYRLVDAFGLPASARAVEESGAAQTGARVVAVDDGFAVTWSELAAGNVASSVRMRRFDANGEPFGPAIDVGSVTEGVAQIEPVLASSLGQMLVVWSERYAIEGSRLGVRGRRFSALGVPIEAPFSLADGEASEPSTSVLGTDDYVVAWTARDNDQLGDIWGRSVPRFGSAPLGSVAVPIVQSVEAERRPVVAGAEAANFVVGLQRGAPLTTGFLHAPSLDIRAVDLAVQALGASDQADLSVVRVPRGIWLAWSERLDQRRALYALLLPLDAARSLE